MNNCEVGFYPVDIVTYVGASGAPRTVKVRAVAWGNLDWNLRKWLWTEQIVPDWVAPPDGRLYQAAIVGLDLLGWESGYYGLRPLDAVRLATPWHWLNGYDVDVQPHHQLFHDAQAAEAAERRREQAEREALEAAEREQARAAMAAEMSLRQEVATARAKVVASPGPVRLADANGEFYEVEGRRVLWRDGRRETGFTVYQKHNGWQITHNPTGFSLGPTVATLDDAAGAAAVLAGMYGHWDKIEAVDDVPEAIRQQVIQLLQALKN